MVLASLSDVRRALGINPTDTTALPDADIQPYLDTSDEWVKEVTGGQWDLPTGQTVIETFYDVDDNQVIKLKDPNPTITSVIPSYTNSQENIVDLFSTSLPWRLMADGNLRIEFSRYAYNPSIPGGWGRSYPRTFERIEVIYIASGVIPKPIRDAVAMIAAATYDHIAESIGGMRSETIGGYSYTIDSQKGRELVIPQLARTYLDTYTRKRRVRIL